MCPNHGPSLAISAEGTYHVTWFTDGLARKGLFYTRSTDSGAGPCRIEMPNWGKLLEERPDLNLVVINADLVPNEPRC